MVVHATASSEPDTRSACEGKEPTHIDDRRAGAASQAACFALVKNLASRPHRTQTREELGDLCSHRCLLYFRVLRSSHLGQEKLLLCPFTILKFFFPPRNCSCGSLGLILSSEDRKLLKVTLNEWDL